MIRLDAATVLLQWATGGLLFCWVTTRSRAVGIGYGWLLRGTYGLMAAGAAVVGLRYGDGVPVREAASIGVVLATGRGARGVGRRGARPGCAGEREHVEQTNARVAAMTGIERNRAAGDATARGVPAGARPHRPGHRRGRAWWPAGIDAGDPAVAVGGPGAWSAPLFLGAVSDAMLLGHWYLVQPGLARDLAPRARPLAGRRLWPFEVAVMLWPTGMVSVLNGSIDDGYGGILGWMWIACARHHDRAGRSSPGRR